MRHKNPSIRSFAWLILLATIVPWSSPARSQVRIAREAIVDAAEVDEILRLGEQLERERRWGEALSHYEEAIRRHPERSDLTHRLTTARLHYDVARRYSDSSFLSTVRNLPEQEALDLYGDVLLKIHGHYVERPDWRKLVDRGTAVLDVAMHDVSFLQRHQLFTTPGANTQFVHEVRRLLAGRNYRNRHDASDAALAVARLGRRHLNLPATAVLMEYTCGAMTVLDEYSAFLTRNQLNEVLSQIEGNFVGLGIELKADDESLLIVNVIRGGPAAQAGLLAGERIVQVDQHDTTEVSTDVAADMLKGVEGSSVQLVIRDSDDRSRRVRVTRSRVEVPSVDNIEIVDAQLGIGYFRLAGFQKTTSRDVDAALWELHRSGMRSLIIDVRGNPGGLLTAAVEVADKFVAQGALVSTRGRSSGEDYDYKAHLIGTWRVPLIVLIDGDSASASEIFAGAISDHRRGTLVGHRSYGKGSVQGIFPLSIADVGVRLTTAKFFSPNGAAISHRGVQPDVQVRTTARIVSDGQIDKLIEPPEDPILNAGLQVARQQMTQR
jgi:carboxyl-terminal processing protease